METKPQADLELRKWVAEKILNYHQGRADTKLIRQDCESLYDFIVKYIK